MDPSRVVPPKSIVLLVAVRQTVNASTLTMGDLSVPLDGKSNLLHMHRVIDRYLTA